MRDGILGTRVCRWVNDKDSLNTQTVLTDGPTGDQPGIYYNIEEGTELVIKQWRCHLTTASDTMEWELGYTDAVNGGGTFTPVTPKTLEATGTAPTGLSPQYNKSDIGMLIKYSSGARSVTFRATGNDAAATATFAYHGYVRAE